MQEHLLGEVSASPELREHFSHDASILEQMPTVIVYPRDENDVRKSVRFAWQLAERGRPIAVTARGNGSGTAGGAVGNGLILALPNHMNKLVDLSIKKRSVITQPGISYGLLEQTLKSHGLLLPACPSLKTSIGGALATNAVGEDSVKFGNIANYVTSLRVVLSNGEVIETGPLDQKDLNAKLGLQTLEGSIYRALDTMLEENGEFIRRGRERIKTHYNSSGYNIFDIRKNNHFNLTPLLLGSEGTLGIITEATFNLVDFVSSTTWVLASLEDVNDLYEIMPKLLSLKPGALEFINRVAVAEIIAINPNQLKDVISRPQAAIHLFVQFNESKAKDNEKSVKELKRIVEQVGGWAEVYADNESQKKVLKFKDAVSTVLHFSQGKQRAVPIAEDISIPVDRLVEMLHKIEQVYAEVELPAIAWGHAGSGVIHTQPLLDISQTGDRQKLFKLQGGLYTAAVELGGSTSASAGDGMIRAPYISLLYGQELYELMLKVKKIFDPHGILNPGVKTAQPDEVKKIMRNHYSIAHLA